MTESPFTDRLNAVLRFLQTARGRTTAALAVVLAMMIFGLWWGISRMMAPGVPQADSRGCVTIEATVVRATGVRVDVFNGSGTEGLGAEVGKNLQEVGFNVGSIANAPEAREKTTILSKDKDSPQAKLVATFFPGSELAQDNRYTATVDVILGTSYSTMNLKAPARIEVPATEKCPTPKADVEATPSAKPSS